MRAPTAVRVRRLYGPDGCTGPTAVRFGPLSARAMCGLGLGWFRAEHEAYGWEFPSVDALPRRTFDIVIANILANPLRLLAPTLAARTALGGKMALCGILSSQADDVIAAYADAVALAPWRIDEGWTLLAGTAHDGR